MYTIPILVCLCVLKVTYLWLATEERSQSREHLHTCLKHYCLNEVVLPVLFFLQSPEAAGVLVRAGGREKLVKPLLNILFRNDNYSKFQVSVCNNCDVYM